MDSGSFSPGAGLKCELHQRPSIDLLSHAIQLPIEGKDSSFYNKAKAAVIDKAGFITKQMADEIHDLDQLRTRFYNDVDAPIEDKLKYASCFLSMDRGSIATKDTKYTFQSRVKTGKSTKTKALISPDEELICLLFNMGLYMYREGKNSGPKGTSGLGITSQDCLEYAIDSFKRCMEEASALGSNTGETFLPNLNQSNISYYLKIIQLEILAQKFMRSQESADAVLEIYWLSRAMQQLKGFNKQQIKSLALISGSSSLYIAFGELSNVSINHQLDPAQKNAAERGILKFALERTDKSFGSLYDDMMNNLNVAERKNAAIYQIAEVPFKIPAPKGKPYADRNLIEFITDRQYPVWGEGKFLDKERYQLFEGMRFVYKSASDEMFLHMQEDIKAMEAKNNKQSMCVYKINPGRYDNRTKFNNLKNAGNLTKNPFIDFDDKLGELSKRCEEASKKPESVKTNLKGVSKDIAGAKKMTKRATDSQIKHKRMETTIKAVKKYNFDYDDLYANYLSEDEGCNVGKKAVDEMANCTKLLKEEYEKREKFNKTGYQALYKYFLADKPDNEYSDPESVTKNLFEEADKKIKSLKDNFCSAENELSKAKNFMNVGKTGARDIYYYVSRSQRLSEGLDAISEWVPLWNKTDSKIKKIEMAMKSIEGKLNIGRTLMTQVTKLDIQPDEAEPKLDYELSEDSLDKEEGESSSDSEIPFEDIDGAVISNNSEDSGPGANNQTAPKSDNYQPVSAANSSSYLEKPKNEHASNNSQSNDPYPAQYQNSPYNPAPQSAIPAYSHGHPQSAYNLNPQDSSSVYGQSQSNPYSVYNPNQKDQFPAYNQESRYDPRVTNQQYPLLAYTHGQPSQPSFGSQQYTGNPVNATQSPNSFLTHSQNNSNNASAQGMQQTVINPAQPLQMPPQQTVHQQFTPMRTSPLIDQSNPAAMQQQNRFPQNNDIPPASTYSNQNQWSQPQPANQNFNQADNLRMDHLNVSSQDQSSIYPPAQPHQYQPTYSNNNNQQHQNLSGASRQRPRSDYYGAFPSQPNHQPDPSIQSSNHYGYGTNVPDYTGAQNQQSSFGQANQPNASRGGYYDNNHPQNTFGYQQNHPTSNQNPSNQQGGGYSNGGYDQRYYRSG